jgi:hypothetical protein
VKRVKPKSKKCSIVPIKTLLLNKQYVPLPRWLVRAAGLRTAVYLSALIDKYNQLAAYDKIANCEISIRAKEFTTNYGLSNYHQNVAISELSKCRIIKHVGANQYRNKLLRVQENWCWFVLKILQHIPEEMRRDLFIELQENKKLRAFLKRRMKEHIESCEDDENESIDEAEDIDSMERQRREKGISRWKWDDMLNESLCDMREASYLHFNKNLFKNLSRFCLSVRPQE